MKTSKTIKKGLFTIGCGAAMIAFTCGCSKDNPLNPTGNCFGGNWAQQYVDEAEAYSNALTAYGENNTGNNCEDVKRTGKAYYEALNDILKCVPTASRAEINQSLDEAKAEIDSEGCD